MMQRNFAHARSIALSVLSALLLVACIGGADAPTGTPAVSSRGGTSTSGRIDPELVGRWSRTTFFQDDSGFHSSQLVWEFNADGGARRIIVTTNITLGLTSTEILPGIWRTTPGSVEITFLSPGSGTVRFSYSVGLTRLLLGEVELERIL